jgi:hypothetical protein
MSNYTRSFVQLRGIRVRSLCIMGTPLGILEGGVGLTSFGPFQGPPLKNFLFRANGGGGLTRETETTRVPNRLGRRGGGGACGL